MPNQIILSMQQNYPFGTEYIPEKENQQVLVRKVINTGNKEKILFNAKYLKKLKTPHSIQIISIFQHTESIQIYYEYVPVKFQIWMKNMSDQLSDNLLKQLYALTTFLAQNKVSTTFNPDNLGLDRNYHIKYFIDLKNTFYNENENSSALKEKYYSEISEFIDSINQKSDKRLSLPLLFQSNQVKSQIMRNINTFIQCSPQNLFKSSSVNTLQLRNQNQEIGSETSENGIEFKQSALGKKCYKTNFNEKLKNIKQQLQLTKKKQQKMNHSLNVAQNSNKNNEFKTKKSQLMKQSAIEITAYQEVSFVEPLLSNQNSPNLIKSQIQKTSEHEISHSQQNIYFIRNVKKNFSQRFKSPKNSQSPIQYLDIVRSSSAYVQDFLNVLEDSSQSDECLVEQREVIQSGQCQERQKNLLRTQSSLRENEKQNQKWKRRLHEVIQNSKSLIKRMQSPVRPNIF